MKIKFKGFSNNFDFLIAARKISDPSTRQIESKKTVMDL